MIHDVFVDALKNDEFVLGSSTLQIGYWEDIYGNSTDIDLDCGPWRELQFYLKSITNCEHAWIMKYAKSPTCKFIAPWEPPSHLQVPQEHIHLLNMYDNVANLTLHDSNQSNIFLSCEAFEHNGTVEISAVINWQNTAVLPLYLTALIPEFINGAKPALGQEEEAFLKEKAYLHKAYHVLYLETDLDIVWASTLSFDGKYTMA
ncbi:hypothetical protein BDQ17DRAFT_1493622 [Cyathus striatus]|nr:hypothetical protein BDQ17DRAFT_1493622 [Cyathus striatus]